MDKEVNGVAVLYEDADLAALAKPAGLVMHGIKANSQKGTAKSVREEKTLADWIAQHYPETKEVGDVPQIRPGMVHRLDRDTSGVVLVARTQAAFTYLKNLFQTRNIRKTYLALVAGRVEGDQGVVEKPIGLRPGTVRRSVHRLETAKMVKAARTEYRVVERFVLPHGECTLLEVSPTTGVTHQIRVHLASLGHPIVGDQMYGVGRQKAYAQALGLARQFLHAGSIEFTAPGGKRLSLSAQLPTDLVRALDQARAGRATNR